MTRINLFIDDSDFLKLKSLPGTLSDHIRFAIRDYLKNLYKVNVSASESERGDENG